MVVGAYCVQSNSVPNLLQAVVPLYPRIYHLCPTVSPVLPMPSPIDLPARNCRCCCSPPCCCSPCCLSALPATCMCACAHACGSLPLIALLLLFPAPSSPLQMEFCQLAKGNPGFFSFKGENSNFLAGNRKTGSLMIMRMADTLTREKLLGALL